jgi:hypothetical protein
LILVALTPALSPRRGRTPICPLSLSKREKTLVGPLALRERVRVRVASKT